MTASCRTVFFVEPVSLDKEVAVGVPVAGLGLTRFGKGSSDLGVNSSKEPKPNAAGLTNGRQRHFDHLHANLGHNGPAKATGIYSPTRPQGYER
jgi:hypothetical protein